MDFNFTVDFDAETIHILVDNYLTLRIVREDDRNKLIGRSKITDELADSLLKISEILFNIEE